MKVVHVETGRHLYGGAQQVLYLTRGLKSRGIDTVLVCTPDAAIRKRAEAQDVAVRALHCAGDLDLRFAWRLREVLSSENPDIVHCHSRRGADFLGGQAALMAGIPAVVSRRVDHEEIALISALRFRPFRKVIAISENVALALAHSGVHKDRIEVIRSGVDAGALDADPDRAAFRQKFDVTAENLLIASIGQLIPRKGHRHLIDVVAKLRPSYPQLRVIVFGRGSLESELKRRATSLGLDDVFRFAGFREDLDSYLACFDLMVHTAVKEGLGIAMLKAAAAGVPVVAFDNAGATEAVVDGETGLLIAKGDSDALVEAIGGLLDAPDIRRSFGERGRQRMREEFSPQVMVDKHIALYESLLGQGVGKPGQDERSTVN